MLGEANLCIPVILGIILRVRANCKKRRLRHDRSIGQFLRFQNPVSRGLCSNGSSGVDFGNVPILILVLIGPKYHSSRQSAIYDLGPIDDRSAKLICFG
jgi:hypothetical protein